MENSSYTVEGKAPQKFRDYSTVAAKIESLKTNVPLFTKMYRLDPIKVLKIIEPILKPIAPGGRNHVLIFVQLCVALRIYLDSVFGYDIPHGSVHSYIWRVLEAIDGSNDPFLNNIKFPLENKAKFSFSFSAELGHLTDEIDLDSDETGGFLSNRGDRRRLDVISV